jgi:hypothetical protein
VRIAFCLRQTTLALLLVPVLAQSGPVERPPLAKALAADAIVLRQGSSSNTVTVTGNDLTKLAEDIESLDRYAWKQESVIKHGACGHSVQVTRGNATLLRLYVSPGKVYIAPKGTTHNPQFVTRVARTDLPSLRASLATLPPPVACPDDA